jgi:hypothetical protein
VNKIEKSNIATSLFDKLRKAIPAITKKTDDSRNWYRNEFEKLISKTSIRQTIIAKSAKRTRIEIGSMYMFLYDPKTKEELPYYDTFPLILPIEMYKDGFLALNLHYLPPTARAKFLDRLNDFRTGRNERQRFLLSYRLLKAAARYKPFERCLKRYLAKQVRSNLLLVEPKDWEVVIYLPTESFQKATAKDVWKTKL